MNALMLSIFLILIIFYKFGASLMGMGFMAKLARDSNSTANSAAFAFFMWIFFLIASGFILFGKGFIR
jgi:hypothetical protein